MPTHIRTFFSTPLWYLIDISFNYGVIVVGLSSSISNLLHMDINMALILAPKLYNVLLKDSFLTIHGIEKQPISFSFGGNLFWKIAMYFSKKATILNSSSFILFYYMSLKNFACVGIYVIAFKKDTLRCMYLNISRNLTNC